MFSERSEWIWLDDEPIFDRYAEFRCAFPAGQDTKLLISAEGRYAVYVNGNYLPSGQYPDFPAAKAVQTCGLNGLTRPGGNELRIEVWYPGEDTSTARKETPGVRFEVLADGVTAAASGEDTDARPIAQYETGADAAMITGQMGRGFSRRFRPDAEWKKAVRTGKKAVCVPRPILELAEKPCPGAVLVSQGAFRLSGGANAAERMQSAGLFWKSARAMASLPPCEGSLPDRIAFPSEDGTRFACAEGDGIYLVFDLGRLYEGCLTLDLTCPAPAMIDIGFGEHLADMRVRTSIDGRNFAVECTASPERGRFIHRFSRFGARYLMLMIYSPEAVIREVTLLPSEYPVSEEAHMLLGDRLHDRIAEVSRRTLTACMHEHYEDCPWREQALYAFDARNQMLAGYYAFGEFTFPRENLRLMALSQNPDGLLELCAPARVPITIPSFSLAFILSLEEYGRYSGDTAFLVEMLPVCENILNWFYPRVTKDGFVRRAAEKRYWNFYEWQPMLDGQTGTAALDGAFEGCLQVFLILALKRMRAVRAMLGLPASDAEEETLGALTRSLEAFRFDDRSGYAAFITSDGRKLCDSELMESLTLYAGVCAPDLTAPVTLRLKDGACETPVTLSYSLFKYEALLLDESLTGFVFDEIARRWGDMLFKGATTFWEVDEGEYAFARAGSLCHGWSAIPYYLYGAYVLGVRPKAPGVWAKTERRKAPFAAEARFRTPDGPLRVKTE